MTKEKLKMEHTKVSRNIAETPHHTEISLRYCQEFTNDLVKDLRNNGMAKVAIFVQVLIVDKLKKGL